jgi:EmrB/QacA subfamily drug resistance transporter
MTYRSKVATVFLLGFFIDLITLFIGSVAYPTIGRSLHASVAELAWVSNGYILGLTLVIPLSAWLSQRIGARRVFLISLLLFSVATAGAALAPGLAALIAWRVIQGIGGGLIIPVGQALTWRLYPPRQRARLSAAVMLVGLLAPALSPSLGGLLVTTLSWRGIFMVSLPVSLLTLLLAACWIRCEPLPSTRPPLHAAGLLSGCGALAALLVGLTWISDPARRLQAVALLLTGGLLAALFIHSSRRHAHPLLPMHPGQLMRFSMLVYQCVPGMFIGISLIAMFYLQAQLGLTPVACGMLMLPWSLASGLAILLTGKHFNHTGPRPLIITGCLLQALGIVVLAQVTAPFPLPGLMMAFALMGAGGSLCSSTAQSSAFLETDDNALPHASALWTVNRQLSFCFGVALLSLLLDLLSAHLALHQAWRLTFYSAALISLLPILASFGVDNRAIVRRLSPCKESV